MTIPPSTAPGTMNAEAMVIADQQKEQTLDTLAHLRLPIL